MTEQHQQFLRYLTIFTIVSFEKVKSHVRFVYTEKRTVPAQSSDSLAEELLSTDPEENVLGWAVQFGNQIRTLNLQGGWKDIASAKFTKANEARQETSPRGRSNKELLKANLIKCGKCTHWNKANQYVERYHKGVASVRRCYADEGVTTYNSEGKRVKKIS